jgi:C-terminal processing protease CtpA/Prc
MRPELGISLSESQAITSPLEIGPSSIGFAERSPKVAGLIGGSPASQSGVKVGDHVFAVDGHSIKSVSDFEFEMSKKTIPGEVVLRVGPTSSESQSVRIVFK